MPNYVNKVARSGGAGEPRVVIDPQEVERALLRANNGRQARIVEGVGGGGGGANGGGGGFLEGDMDAREGDGRRKIETRGAKKWSDEERRFLWECFVRSGGKRSGGYIKKMKDLWDERGMNVRSLASLSSQLKQIVTNNLLTVVVRGEIERMVNGEREQEVVDGDEVEVDEVQMRCLRRSIGLLQG